MVKHQIDGELDDNRLTETGESSVYKHRVSEVSFKRMGLTSSILIRDYRRLTQDIYGISAHEYVRLIWLISGDVYILFLFCDFSDMGFRWVILVDLKSSRCIIYASFIRVIVLMAHIVC